MNDNERLVEDLFPDKEDIKFHMLSACLQDRIVTQSNSALIVTVSDWYGNLDMKFMQQ